MGLDVRIEGIVEGVLELTIEEALLTGVERDGNAVNMLIFTEPEVRFLSLDEGYRHDLLLKVRLDLRTLGPFS